MIKNILLLILIPFWGISQTVSDTIINSDNEIIIRIIDASDTTKVNNIMKEIDDSIKLLEKRISELKKNKVKFKAVVEDKRKKTKSNNSPKDSPW